MPTGPSDSPYRQTDQDEQLRAPACTQEGLVCECIPYLILPVRQSSREPFGRRQSVRRLTEPDRYNTSKPPGKPPGPSRAETIYASRLARRRACVAPSTEALMHLSAASETTVDLGRRQKDM